MVFGGVIQEAAAFPAKISASLSTRQAYPHSFLRANVLCDQSLNCESQGCEVEALGTFVLRS